MSLLLGLPVPFPGVLFIQHAKEPLFGPKELGLNPPPPPQKTPEITSKESYGKDGKNKVGGEG